MKSKKECNWFLVTSIEQGKAEEAIEIRSHATHFIHQDHYLVLNKCLESELSKWSPQNEDLTKIKNSLELKEINLKKQLKDLFPVVLEFPEVMSLSPNDHLLYLTKTWKSHAL